MAYNRGNAMTVEMIANLFVVSPQRVRQFIQYGWLSPAERLGRMLLFDSEAVAEFYHHYKTHGSPPKNETPWLAKTRVRSQTANAIQAGRLVRQACESCGAPKGEAHHDDYSKPFDIRWLCRPCHLAHHRDQRKKAAAALA